MAEEKSLTGRSLVYVLVYMDSILVKLSSLLYPSEEDLPFLTRLHKLVPKWKRIGVQLGVPVFELETIQQNNRGGVGEVWDCLRDTFIWWLQNGENVTVRKLIKAVHDVCEHQVEVEINQKFGKYLDTVFVLNPTKFSVRLKYT